MSEPAEQSTRLCTFEETAVLMEGAPKRVWLRIGWRPILTGSPRGFFTAKDLKSFISLNRELFGPDREGVGDGDCDR